MKANYFIKKIIFSLLLVILVQLSVGNNHESMADGNVYIISYDYGYKGGYSGGKEEKAKGYDYEPEVVLAQPLFQMLLQSLKQKVNESQRDEFDRGFRDGFNDGYKDGYYGHPEKKTVFD